MKYLIIANGIIDNYSFYEGYADNFDVCLCADGGYKHAERMRIKPDIVIGDFDSICLDNIDCKTIIYPPEKDMTDLEICIEYAISNGAEDISIIGALGGRLDHAFCNIMLLLKCIKMGIKAHVHDENYKIRIINGNIKDVFSTGEIVSLFSVEGKAKVSLEGFKYKLSYDELDIGSSFGVSNIVISDKNSIKVHSGSVLCISTSCKSC